MADGGKPTEGRRTLVEKLLGSDMNLKILHNPNHHG